MKNTFLKQVSFLVLGVALVMAGIESAEAGSKWKSGLKTAEKMTNLSQSGSLINSASSSKGLSDYNENFVMNKVKSYANGKDMKGKKWLEVLESPWAGLDGFQGVTHGKMYKQIAKKINGLKNVDINNIKVGNMGGNFSKDIQDLKDDITEGAKGMMDTFSMDAWKDALDAAKDDIKFGVKELGITSEAASELERQINGNNGTVSGIPTVDFGNVAIGMYNVDSVIETFHYDEDIRDMDTRICAEMGVSGLSGDASTGEFCCLLWEESGDSTGFGALKGALSGAVTNGSSGLATGALGGAIGAWDSNRLAAKRGRAGYDYCCRLSDDKKRGDEYVLCQAKSEEKAECLNGKLKGGSTAESAWKACNIECGEVDSGYLSYNEDGKYDEKEVDKLMKECYKEENKWSPSTTVPTSSELAPVIPDVAKEGVTGKKGGSSNE